MKILSITLKDFLSHKHTHIDFTNPTTCIIGSNGHGKSAILKGISYALFGRIPSSSKMSDMELINAKALGQMWVEVNVEKGGETKKVKRGRLPDGSPTLDVEGFNGNKTTVEKQLKEWLGLTYEDFIALYYFTQEDIHQFLQGDKASYFTRWTDSLSKWYVYGDKIKDERRTLKKELSDLEKQRISLESKMSQYDTLDEREKDLLSQQEKNNTSYHTATELLSDLQAKKTHLEEKKAEYDKVETERRINVARIKSEIDSTKRDLERANNCMCPILEIGCELLKAHKDQSVPSLEMILEDLESKLRELEMDKATFDLAEYHNLLGRIQKGQTYTSKLFNESTLITYQLKQIQKDKGERDGSIEVLQQNTARQEIVTKRDRALAYLQHACSDRGIPLFILVQEMGKVEQLANWILEVMESSQRLRFSPYQELQEYEKTCPVCENTKWNKGRCTSCDAARPKKRKYQPTIDVFSGKQRRSFDLVSGGEKVLLSFAVRLACSHLVGTLTGVHSELIILDETFAMLDDENRSKLLNLCVERLPNLGIKQIIVVSHHDDVTVSIPHTLRVNKIDDVSIVS